MIFVVRLMLTVFKTYNMEAKDLLEIKALEGMNENKNHGWSRDTALWIIAAVIVVGFIAWLWSKGNTEKTEIAVGLAKLSGRVDSIEPTVTANTNNVRNLEGVTSAIAQGTKDIKENVYNQLFQLNDEIFYNPSRRSHGGCGCGNREFKQTSTYNLASTNVTVDETCRN